MMGRTTTEYGEKTDDELMALTATRDHRAAVVLIARHQRPLLNLFYRYTADRTLSEDLAQEVFLRVYKSAPLYEPRSVFRIWLYRIAKNICFNEMKATRGRRELPEEIIGQDDPGEALIASERAIRVRQAVASLPERQKLALILRRFHGLSQHETAETMETTPEAIESLMARAKAKLKILLADLAEG
ncbi:MAG: sigma-70 family RNA polymerase sigma factor [Pseudomonadota bacterium]